MDWQGAERKLFPTTLTPPWLEFYVNDGERQHDLAEAVAEYDRLLVAYRELEYELTKLSEAGVADRADIIQSHISYRPTVELEIISGQGGNQPVRLWSVTPISGHWRSFPKL